MKANVEALPDANDIDVTMILISKEIFNKMSDVASRRGVDVVDVFDEAVRNYLRDNSK